MKIKIKILILFILLLAVFFVFNNVCAQNTINQDTLAENNSLTLKDFIKKGGILIYPILFAGFVGATIFIERFIFLLKSDIEPEKFMNKVEICLKKNQLKDCLTLCNEKSTPLTRVVRAGVIKYEKQQKGITKTLEENILIETGRMERLVPWLGVCATVSPLLGLAGTVVGMINTFMAISQYKGIVRPEILAKGIYEALVTTAAGLLVGIPCLIAYEYIVMKLNRMYNDIDKSSVKLLNILDTD